MNKKLLYQIGSILLICAFFLSLNGGMYLIFTGRLSNNFSSAAQAKMIDVSRYLPHEEDSELPAIAADLPLKGDLPVLDGAAALVPVYAAIIHNVYPEGSVGYEGGVFSDDNFYGENFAPDSKMQYKNTVRGFEAVVNGETDLFFSAAPSAEQRQYAKDRGVELVYVPVGLEAFVFFVNEQNPVNGLTVEQIRNIYQGKCTNWSEVGGVNRPINPVSRLRGSGSQSAMDAFIGSYDPANKSPFALFGASIGFSFRYYMDGIVGNQAVKMLELNGVYPSEENIQNGSYPFIAEFYAVYRADSQNENIPLLINWLLSPKGQRLIEECGYVAIKDGEQK